MNLLEDTTWPPDLLMEEDEKSMGIQDDAYLSVDLPLPERPASCVDKGQEVKDEATIDNKKDQSVDHMEEDDFAVNNQENCVVLNSTGSDTREVAIKFIENLPESMLVSSITLHMTMMEYGPGEGGKVPPPGQEEDRGPGEEASPNSTCDNKVKVKKIKHEKGIFTCSVCEKKYSYASNLSRHVKQKHKPRDDIVCSKCMFVFKRKDYLKTHSIKCQKKTTKET